MKPTQPNALLQELALSQKAGPHPDPDLLTAFAESALLPREREYVLAHLSACEECRQIIHTAAMAAPEREAQAASAPHHRTARLRTWLPWFAAAACVAALIVTVVLLHQNPRATPPPAEVAANTTQPAPAIPAAHTITPPVSKTDKTLLLTHRAPTLQIKKVPPIPVPPPPTATSRLATEDELSSQSAGAVTVQAVPPPMPEAKSLSAEAQPAFAGNFPQAATSARSAFAARRTHWRLSEDGQMERSFATGTWQPVLEGTKFRVLSVSGPDIWAGGDHLMLLHSADDGKTWAPVALPGKSDKSGKVPSVAHIRLQTAQSLTVEADDGSSWTTTDGGKTWQ